MSNREEEPSDFPTPDEISKHLEAERVRNLIKDAREILEGGGSHESLELAGGLIKEAATLAETPYNAYPNLNVSEISDVAILENMIDAANQKTGSGLKEIDWKRYAYLLKKVVG